MVSYSSNLPHVPFTCFMHNRRGTIVSIDMLVDQLNASVGWFDFLVNRTSRVATDY